MMKLTWDYNYQEHSNVFGHQKDWNQTLITKINMMSAMIHQKTHKGGANKIKINSTLLPLFRDLEYFRIDDYNEMFLAGRYHITIDDSLSKNIILLSLESNHILDAKEKNCVFCFRKSNLENSDTYEIILTILKIDSVEYYQALSDPNCTVLIEENLRGEIEILNYE